MGLACMGKDGLGPRRAATQNHRLQARLSHTGLTSQGQGHDTVSSIVATSSDSDVEVSGEGDTKAFDWASRNRERAAVSPGTQFKRRP